MGKEYVGLMFPKKGKKKKRKKHGVSILHQRDGTCYLCVRLHRDFRYHDVLHKHHIYRGPCRDISEAEGFYVYLCLEHHEIGKEAVHNNKENMELLQVECQRKYEESHTRQQFMELIGKNYLEVKDDYTI